MTLYTFEDLTRDNNVTELARQYARLGAIAADSSRGASIDKWWKNNSAGVILRPIRCRQGAVTLDYTLSVERFAWMYFKQGWNAAKGTVQR